MTASRKEFLLVEPTAKTPYPPLGLMKIGTMLKKKFIDCRVCDVVGTNAPRNVRRPERVYITSLFTWDAEVLIGTIHFYADKFPRARILVGGIAATLLPDLIRERTGLSPHVGLLRSAERCAPDYSLSFGRVLRTSLVFASRGCPRRCTFCSVRAHEPKFEVVNGWQRSVHEEFPTITFWDNNWLASPNRQKDIETMHKLGKPVDFNQGLDARLYTASVAKELGKIRVNPVRFALDSTRQEQDVVRAVRLAKKHGSSDIR